MQEYPLKKITTILFLILLTKFSSSFAESLSIMNQKQLERALVNKTLISIPADNLNGRDIANTFTMFLDGKGNIMGKLSYKPANEPQFDTGIYRIKEDGTFYITWDHWDGAKELCGHLYNTKNAYISIDCDNVFHTVFLKSAIRAGNFLK